MTDFSVGILVGAVVFAASASAVFLIIYVRRKNRKRTLNGNVSRAESITGNPGNAVVIYVKIFQRNKCMIYVKRELLFVLSKIEHTK